jgi:hypothetical protein
MNEKTLTIKWTTSRGRETQGYNICTVWDGDKAYRCSGGGYDMLGTSFAYWLQANYMPRIIERLKPHEDRQDEWYGFFKRGDKYFLDGACGISSIEKIAKDIGLRIQIICNRKGHRTHMIISERIEA